MFRLFLMKVLLLAGIPLLSALSGSVAAAENDMKTSAHAANQSTNLKLFEPALTFHWCVERETSVALKTIPAGRARSPEEVEGSVWGQVLKACLPVLTSRENRAMVYENYRGGEQRIRDFQEGVLWSGRAYVFSAVDDWSKFKR